MKKSGSGGKSGGGKTTPSGRNLTVRVKASNQRSVSSTRWLQRQLNDPYVAEARRLGYRSRAAFKIIQLDEKLDLLKPGMRVLDLGAAPGGWTQICVDRCVTKDGRGCVVGIDLLPIDPIAGATLLQGDFLDPAAPDKLKALLGGQADIVLSDMSPSTTGHATTDHLRIMGLTEVAAEFAFEVLAPGGAFVAKVFQGGAERELLVALQRHFTKVRHVKPAASRPESPETYVVATGFRK